MGQAVKTILVVDKALNSDDNRRALVVEKVKIGWWKKKLG